MDVECVGPGLPVFGRWEVPARFRRRPESRPRWMSVRCRTSSCLRGRTPVGGPMRRGSAVPSSRGIRCVLRPRYVGGEGTPWVDTRGPPEPESLSPPTSPATGHGPRRRPDVEHPREQVRPHTSRTHVHTHVLLRTHTSVSLGVHAPYTTPVSWVSGPCTVPGRRHSSGPSDRG